MSAPKMLPALMGGLFIGVLSSLPYIKGGNVCCCLWVVSGGILAAWLMQQNTPRPITVGEGALVGLLSGLAGTFVWMAWAIVGMFVFSSTPFDVADFQRAMTEGGRDVPPEAREALENLSPAVILVVGGVIWAVVSMVFATIGGLLGALLFRRKGDPTAGLPTAPPPTFTPPTFTPPTPGRAAAVRAATAVAAAGAADGRGAAGERHRAAAGPVGARPAAAEQLAGAADGRPVRRRRADDHDPGARPEPAAVAEAARAAGAAIWRRAAS